MSPHASEKPGVSPADTGFALRQWISHTSRAPEPPAVATMVAVLVCSIYQSLLVALLLFGGSGGAPAMTQTGAGAVLVGVGAIAAAVVLAWMPRIPLLVLAAELAMLIAAAYVSLQDAVLFPALFAVFGAASRLPAAKLLVAAVMIVTGTTATAALVSGREGFVAEYLGLLSAVLTAVAIGVAARSVRGWRRSRLQTLSDIRTTEQLTRQRNQAEARSQIAAELHDSVGHKLTSIIALSEGLLGTAAGFETEEAIQGINAVARESLAETRRAVRALAGVSDGSGGVAHGGPPWDGAAPASRGMDQGADQRDPWEQAAALVDQARSLGLAVEFTEVGERTQDLTHALLCFTLTREALTNAVRHGGVPGSADVTWEHRSGDTRIAVRNSSAHPRGGSQPHGSPGTGLLRLRGRIEALGGTLTYGWAASRSSSSSLPSWTVDAVIPVAGASSARSPGPPARSRTDG